MSKIDRMVELIPPGINRMSEQLVSKGHTCGYCHGNGYFWGVDSYGESIKNLCPACKGKKTVDAVITIEWNASV
jgi:DnaJ-class molecular chaperone